ncbi:hypothetical protein FQN60_004859 [Etheostoma spectabile]|uniref:Uncharacterized protein n=1 Tax=Etheostoma spectabile TaxID=54343 RepID=A0A5J5DKU0_9PERO|nr:hypothetical protein FQN60_004859 [Etheostoma spectabile]
MHLAGWDEAETVKGREGRDVQGKTDLSSSQRNQPFSTSCGSGDVNSDLSWRTRCVFFTRIWDVYGRADGAGTADDVDGAPYRVPDASERDGLLSVQTSSHNGEVVVHAAEAQSSLGNTYTPQKNSLGARIKRELNDDVCWKVKLWMVISSCPPGPPKKAKHSLLTFKKRKGSVIADYQLTFVMPEEEQDQLRNVTLSREMVYNVFRQFLYDQEQPGESGQMYIDPVSLNMALRH